MEISWADIWEIFHFSLIAAVIAGITCPLVGCFLLVRRTGFYGITLPQFASAGVAFGFAALPWWVEHIGLSDMDLVTAIESPHEVINYHLSWAGVFTFAGLAALGLLGRRKETETGRVAASFAIATALTILFAQASPTGREFVEVLMHGEILAVTSHELETLAVVYGLVLALLAVFHRDLLLTSYDSDFARVIGKSTWRYEALLLVLTGTTVSLGTLIVGPVVLFGLLVIPPLAARGLAFSMRSFYALAAGFGVLATLAGIWLSFRLDWPLGPSIVAAASGTLVPGWVGSLVRRS